jgi:hypothetical protein
MRRAEPAAPMTPEGQAKFDYNTHELKDGGPITIDPAYTCHWPGLPHIYFSGAYAFEFVQTPQRIFIFYENTHQWREIWMDGRTDSRRLRSAVDGLLGGALGWERPGGGKRELQRQDLARRPWGIRTATP